MFKLTVIIPMYNVAPYLQKCLKSVYDQNLMEDEFEVILINDESPDNSLSIAEHLTKGYKNAKIISQKNKGLGGARNTGIKHATGEYILFLDADDWYLPGTLSQVFQMAKEHSLEIVEFGAQGITMDNKVVYTKSLSSEVLTGIKYYQHNRYMDSACNKLYNRLFLLGDNLFFMERLYIEDYEFNTRVFYKAKKVMGIDIIVAQFLQTPDSITRTFDKTKKLKMREDIITVIEKTNTLYGEVVNNNELQLNQYFKQRLGYLTATLFYQLFKSGSSYNDFITLRAHLRHKNIYFSDYYTFDKGKDLFRIIFLKHFVLLKFASQISKIMQKVKVK